MLLSSIYSDGMIIQRDKPILIKGYAYGNQVTVTFAGQIKKVTPREDSYFEVVLPSMVAGGPYEMVLYDGEKTLISDIMVGDVYVLGGQSNMELPISRTLDVSAEDVKEVDYPNIRLFEVAKEYNFTSPVAILEQGSWVKADTKSVMNFSAAGYFMAKHLYDTYQVPIGLVQTAVGGTPIEAWMSEEVLTDMGICKEQLERNKDSEWVNQTIASDNERINQWHRTMREKDAGIIKGWQDGQKSATFTNQCIIPGMWENTELSDYKGSIWFTKEFEVPLEWIGQEVLLRLGAMVDGDETFVNGVLVGHTEYRYPPRNYIIPPALLCEGKNTVTIRLFSDGQQGGFMPGKQYGLKCQNTFLSLEGEWSYEKGAPMERLAPQTFFQYEPAGVFNKMIAPLKGLSACAIAFYQGESNAGKPEGYADKMERMVKLWREIFGQEKLPFLYVGLAKFTDGKINETNEDFEALRKEQKKALLIENSSMVDAYDLGEYNDLHPQNKKELGRRLFLAAKQLVYKENIDITKLQQDKVFFKS